MITIENIKGSKPKQDIYFHFIDGKKFKTNMISILFTMPLSKEKAAKAMLLAEVMKQGCRKYNDRLLFSRKLEEMYGSILDISVIKKGDNQLIHFYFEAINENNDETELLQQGMELMNEVINHPIITGGGFPKKIVHRQKELILDRINERIDDKKEYAKERLIEEMFKGEPFGISEGNCSDQLDEITASGVYEYYKEVMDKGIVDVIICAKTTEEKAKGIVSQVFKNRNTKCGELEIWKNTPKTIMERTNAEQGRLCMGFSSNLKLTGKDFYSGLVLNEILGGSGGSRLYNAVREKEGLCYYINSYLYRYKMFFMIQAGIDENFMEKTVDIIKSETDRLGINGARDDELEKAKASLVNWALITEDNPISLMDFALNGRILGEAGDLDTFRNGIKSVTLSDIGYAAKNLALDTIFFLHKGGNENGTDSKK